MRMNIIDRHDANTFTPNMSHSLMWYDMMIQIVQFIVNQPSNSLIVSQLFSKYQAEETLLFIVPCQGNIPYSG